jgi:hypothetical protein
MFPLAWLPLAHTCNPSCSGSRGQMDLLQSQTRQIVHEILSWKKKKKLKKSWWSGSGAGPEFKLQYCNKTNKQTNKSSLFFNPYQKLTSSNLLLASGLFVTLFPCSHFPRTGTWKWLIHFCSFLLSSVCPWNQPHVLELGSCILYYEMTIAQL